MLTLVRVLTLALLFGLGLFLTGTPREQASAVMQCDASYPNLCLPPGLAITCFDIGFQIPVVHGPGATDPYFLDPDFDGVGCEEF